jgi:hypothetical protein
MKSRKIVPIPPPSPKKPKFIEHISPAGGPRYVVFAFLSCGLRSLPEGISPGDLLGCYVQSRGEYEKEGFTYKSDGGTISGVEHYEL